MSDTFLGGDQPAQPAAEVDDRVPSIVTGGVELYDRHLYWKDAQRDFTKGLTESAAFTPDEAAAVAGSYSKLFATFSLSGAQAGDMFAAIRGAHEAPPTKEQQAAWATEARAGLVEEYGSDGAAQALRDANALLNQNPRWRDNVRKLGIGSHPRVVKALADRAREAKKAGTLK